MEELATFDIQFSEARNAVGINAKGRITVDLVVNNLEKVFSSTAYKTGMNAVLNLTEADLSELIPESMTAMVTAVNRFANTPVNIKAAIVSEKSINLGMINLFKEYYSNDKIELRVFQMLQEAHDWIFGGTMTQDTVYN